MEARRWLGLALNSGLPIAIRNRAAALQHMGLHAATQRDYVVAEALIIEARELFEALNDRAGIAGCYFGLGRIAMFSGDSRRALDLYNKGIPISREAGGQWLTGLLGNAGDAATTIGDFERASRYFDEGLLVSRRTDDLASLSVMLTGSGLLAIKMNDLARARQLMDEGLRIHHEHLPERRYATQALEERAWLAAVEHQPERTARLLGAASHQRERMGVPMPPNFEAECEQYIPSARNLVDSAVWERASHEGRAMSLEDAIRYALSDDQ